MGNYLEYQPASQPLKRCIGEIEMAFLGEKFGYCNNLCHKFALSWQDFYHEQQNMPVTQYHS